MLAGFSSGRIAHIKADDMTTTDVGEVPGEPLWIGTMNDGRTVVVYRAPADPRTDVPWGKPKPQRVRVLETAREVALGDDDPSTYLLDSRGRLWMGEEHGEWGGGVSFVDPVQGSEPTSVDAPDRFSGTYPFNGVYGFLEVEAGIVLAFGGISHLGSFQAFVAELTPDAPPKRIYFGDGHIFPRRAKRRSDRPDEPISHVIKKGADRYLVISGERIFETNRNFSKWKVVTRVPARPVRGRPDAVGSYPAIRTVHLSGDRMLLATTRDGFIELAGAATVSHALPNQIALEPYSFNIWGDTLLVEGVGSEPMAYRNGKWQLAHPLIDPPAHSAAKSERGYPLTWDDIRWDRADDDTLWVVAKEKEVLPGGGEFATQPARRLLVAKRTADRFVVASDEPTELSPGPIYGYPEGQLVAVDFQHGSWIFKGGRWRPLDPPDRSVVLRGRLGSIGAGQVVRMSGPKKHGLAIYDPLRARITPFDVPADWANRDDVRKSNWIDALPWGERQLLLATSTVVCIFDLAGKSCPSLPNGPVDGAVELLARDSSGRVWLGGRSLWALDARGNVTSFGGAAPILRDTEVLDLFGTRDRLGVAMGPRGLLVIDTSSVGPARDCEGP